MAVSASSDERPLATGEGHESQPRPDAPAIDREDDTAARSRRDARDQVLVRKIRAGDARAFQELVHSYQNRVFGLTYRMIGNRSEAEDLAQEVFLIVHRAIGTYRGEGRLATWIYRIAANTCRNRIKYLRGRQFHRRVPVEESPEADASPGVTLPSQTAGPDAQTEGRRLERAIQRELEALDPEHRMLIILRDVQGLSYHEILRVTGLQEGTLKSRLHRARLALKERLRPYLE